MHELFLTVLEGKKGQEGMKRLARIKIWVDERESYLPVDYVKCQWTRGSKNAAWFLYRLLTAIWFVEAMVASFLTVKYTPDYWLTYFTHWSFIMATLQSLIALLLVSLNQADKFDPAGGRIQNKLCKIYEWLHATATVQAISVSIIYWSFVYQPPTKQHPGGPVFPNLQMHAFNSVLMLLDLMLIGFPTRIVTVILPLIMTTMYLTFNLVYYLAGGTRYDGKPYIYKVLDWRNPKIAATIFALSPLGVIIIHSLIWWFAQLRRSIAGRAERRRVQKTFEPNGQSQAEAIEAKE